MTVIPLHCGMSCSQFWGASHLWPFCWRFCMHSSSISNRRGKRRLLILISPKIAGTDTECPYEQIDFQHAARDTFYPTGHFVVEFYLWTLIFLSTFQCPYAELYFIVETQSTNCSLLLSQNVGQWSQLLLC
jgi:hypothetical protein